PDSRPGTPPRPGRSGPQTAGVKQTNCSLRVWLVLVDLGLVLPILVGRRAGLVRLVLPVLVGRALGLVLPVLVVVRPALGLVLPVLVGRALGLVLPVLVGRVLAVLAVSLGDG